jgi:hypothetical protein
VNGSVLWYDPIFQAYGNCAVFSPSRGAGLGFVDVDPGHPRAGLGHQRVERAARKFANVYSWLTDANLSQIKLFSIRDLLNIGFIN